MSVNDPAVTAMLAWVRGLTRGSPAQASRQTRHAQFHCGKPPPAAEPSTITERRPMRRHSLSVAYAVRKQERSEFGRQIAVDLEPDADFDKNGSGPRHCIPPHDALDGRKCEPAHVARFQEFCKYGKALYVLLQFPIAAAIAAKRDETLYVLLQYSIANAKPNELQAFARLGATQPSRSLGVIRLMWRSAGAASRRRARANSAPK
jgi:hypothetical protein